VCCVVITLFVSVLRRKFYTFYIPRGHKLLVIYVWIHNCYNNAISSIIQIISVLEYSVQICGSGEVKVAILTNPEGLRNYFSYGFTA